MDLSLVWDAQSFLAAAIAGFLFGLFLAVISLLPVWDQPPPPRLGLLCAWVSLTGAVLIVALVFSQVFVNLSDPLWPRILSRMFPYLTGAIMAGPGMFVGFVVLGRRRRE